MTNGNDEAYPAKRSEHDFINGGLTKREYFAAMAMQGLLAGAYTVGHLSDTGRAAVEQADALIAALNKESKDA